MISGVNRDAHNIFSSSSDAMSRIRSGGGARSESDLRDLSRKDTMTMTDITKDEIEYEIDDAMFEQGKEWQDEEFERAFGTFS